MRSIFIIVTLVVLASCSEDGERTYTVDEFMSDGGLLKRTVTECRDNPGDLRDTANCRNAEAADGKLRLQNMRKALGG